MERKKLHRGCKNTLSCISNRAAKGIHPNPHFCPGQDRSLSAWTQSQPFIHPLASVVCYKCGTKGKQQKPALDCGIYFKPRLFIYSNLSARIAKCKLSAQILSQTVRKHIGACHGKSCLDSIVNSPPLSLVSYHSGQVSVLWILLLQLQWYIFVHSYKEQNLKYTFYFLKVIKYSLKFTTECLLYSL